MKTKRTAVKKEQLSKEPKTTAEKGQFYISLTSLILSILIGIVTICLTIFQSRLSQMQTELNQVFSPITYEVFESEKKFQYDFSGKEISQGYPCVRFTNGRPKNVAVILYNSNNKKTIVTSSAIQTTTEILIKDIQTEMPRDEYDAGAAYAYDYFFLYFTDSNNKEYLDMVYYQINLQEGTASNCIIASKADLLLLENDSLDQYKREMLADYRDLLKKIGDIDALM